MPIDPPFGNQSTLDLELQAQLNAESTVEGKPRLLAKLHSASRQRHIDEWFHRLYTRLERYPPSLKKHHDQDLIDS